MGLQDDVDTITGRYDTTVTTSSPPTTGLNRVAGIDPNRTNIRFSVSQYLSALASEAVQVGVLLNGVYTPVVILVAENPSQSYDILKDGPIVQGEWYAVGITGPFRLTVVSCSKIR